MYDVGGIAVISLSLTCPSFILSGGSNRDRNPVEFVNIEIGS